MVSVCRTAPATNNSHTPPCLGTAVSTAAHAIKSTSQLFRAFLYHTSLQFILGNTIDWSKTTSRLFLDKIAAVHCRRLGLPPPRKAHRLQFCTQSPATPKPCLPLPTCSRFRGLRLQQFRQHYKGSIMEVALPLHYQLKLVLSPNYKTQGLCCKTS